ncbi:tryptophan-rich sensory protein [Brevibacterium sp. 5221]|uniref:Tryptophan-rich sensory protein n=1 Tax=Brevibacterium rongguiense TaxID=2695267 RepID=A0A6N9H5E5_9MICO|nr:TspO/MBR family protein [Brevibacterium rongguiense]MYM18824.1 tryptophan-rich sensory protein [Brevibacterium rongguiense]
MGTYTQQADTAPSLAAAMGRLALASSIVAAAAWAGTKATMPKVGLYERLELPAFAPPRKVFPIAWTGLFALTAVTSAVGMSKAKTKAKRRRILRSLVVNMGLNAAWSYLFWQVEARALSAAEAALLAASAVELAVRIGKESPAAGAALAPYPAWCAFATVLASAIAQRNPEG